MINARSTTLSSESTAGAFVGSLTGCGASVTSERQYHTYTPARRLLLTLRVHLQVLRQAVLLAEAPVAVLTCIRLLSSVQPQVPRQAALVARAEVAMSTCIRLLSTVQPQVRRQVARDARAEVAMLACIRLLSTVHPQVSRQVTLLCESRVAVLADVHHHLRTRQ
jgi:hypothetical protein